MIMPPTLPVATLPATTEHTARRAPWRQRLVEAERGLSCGLRGDCTLYAYLFVDCLTIAMGVILKLSSWQWIIVGLVVTLVLTAELMCQALRSLIMELKRTNPDGRWHQVQHLATAAVTVALLGGSCLIGALFWQRIRDLYNL